MVFNRRRPLRQHNLPRRHVANGTDNALFNDFSNPLLLSVAVRCERFDKVDGLGTSALPGLLKT